MIHSTEPGPSWMIRLLQVFSLSALINACGAFSIDGLLMPSEPIMTFAMSALGISGIPGMAGIVAAGVAGAAVCACSTDVKAMAASDTVHSERTNLQLG